MSIRNPAGIDIQLQKPHSSRIGDLTVEERYGGIRSLSSGEDYYHSTITIMAVSFSYYGVVLHRMVGGRTQLIARCPVRG